MSKQLGWAHYEACANRYLGHLQHQCANLISYPSGNEALDGCMVCATHLHPSPVVVVVVVNVVVGVEVEVEVEVDVGVDVVCRRFNWRGKLCHWRIRMHASPMSPGRPRKGFLTPKCRSDCVTRTYCTAAWSPSASTNTSCHGRETKASAHWTTPRSHLLPNILTFMNWQCF